MSGAERNGFVIVILWLENVGVVVAPEARYGQALISVPGDDDSLMEFVHIRNVVCGTLNPYVGFFQFNAYENLCRGTTSI
jgi:hypothetical protein